MRTLAPTLAAALVLTFAFASPALGQAPGAPTPVYTVAIMNAPGAFPALSANASVTAPFQVVLTIGNVVCANAVTIPVEVTAAATGAPPSLVVTVEPPVVNVTISQGPHGAPPVGTFGGGTGDAVAKATITGNITANASVEVTLTATAPAPPGAPDGCQGAGQVGSATSAPVVVFANMTAPPPPPPPEPTPEDTPGFGVAALVVAAALVAAARRKEK